MQPLLSLRTFSTPHGQRRRLPRVLATLAAATVMVATAVTTASADGTAPPSPAPAVAAVAPAPVGSFNGLAAKPYMGWSSWSLQSTKYPGVNPDGPGSFISAANIVAQADAMAAKLKPFGYEYVNIDAGWQDGTGANGLPAVNAARFPDGIAAIADHVHSLGLKLGIYTTVGLDKTAYAGGTTPVAGAPGCTSAQLVYPDLRLTNGWDSNYKIDYSSPCAQQYADSIAALFASWGVDFIKMDGVGPGSFVGGENHDNTADVTAWAKAITAAGRPMQYVLSWSLSHTKADVWKASSNGWRIDTDVECYCNTIVRWDESVKQRFTDVVQWIDDAGPGHWNNLDAVDVGVGSMDGLTDAERQTYMTFWAIEAAPLFSGDDLTKLDDYGLSLLTNREVIAIDQAGRPAHPVSQATPQQTWYSRNADGSVTVALFNLADGPATVTASWKDVGLSGSATVRDVWQGATIGTRTNDISASLPGHGSKLYTITPKGLPALLPAMPTGVRATAVTSSSVTLAWRDGRPAARTSYRVYDGSREVARSTGDTVTVTGLVPSTSHTFTVRTSKGLLASASSAAVSITTPAAGGPTLYEAEAPGNALTGSASNGGCSGCSGGGKVGNLGGSSTMTFASISVPVAGDYLATLAYVDGDSSRQGVLTVNGDAATAVGVNLPGTGDNDWDHAQPHQVMLHLRAGVNTVTFGNPSWYAPDIDALTL